MIDFLKLAISMFKAGLVFVVNHFEDPVTGAVHCALAPYWGKQLKKGKLTAKQLSPRGSQL